MSLYQSSVLKKFQAAQDATQITEAFGKFSAYFLDPSIQENIRNSKEEQFQEGFLRELFVNILGYTINPNPDYNLTTELKNIKDAKKTDGAILTRGHVPLSKTRATSLSLEEEAEWLTYFNKKKTEANALQAEIDKIDKDIDQMVYELYGLTEEDIEIVENS